jgi:hypothetical protein
MILRGAEPPLKVVTHGEMRMEDFAAGLVTVPANLTPNPASSSNATCMRRTTTLIGPISTRFSRTGLPTSMPTRTQIQGVQEVDAG